MAQPIVSLLSDLGTRDPYLALVKARIVLRVQSAQMLDITHEINPFDLRHAAYLLREVVPSLPKGTVHLVMVDTLQRPDRGFVAAEWGGHFFVAPDNGLLSFVFDKAPARAADLSALAGQIGITVFPERDLMAEAAAHLAKGGDLKLLGQPMADIKREQTYHPYTENANTLVGQVLHVDRYGNLITNISRQMFVDVGRNRSFEILLRLRQYTIREISSLYEDQNVDPFGRDSTTLALFGSSGRLEIAMRRANASQLMGIRVGDNIRIEFK